MRTADRHTPDARDVDAEGRDDAADDRDSLGQARQETIEAWALAARGHMPAPPGDDPGARRHEAATERELLHSYLDEIAAEHAAARHEREAAAEDRERAREDRAAARRDRDASSADRRQSAVERGVDGT